MRPTAATPAALVRRYRYTLGSTVGTFPRLLGREGRRQWLAWLKAEYDKAGGRPLLTVGSIVDVEVTHETRRCNILTTGFACTCRQPVVAIEAIYPPGTIPTTQEVESLDQPELPSFDRRATAIGRARAHGLGLMGNIMALARLTPDTDVEGLKLIRHHLHHTIQVVLGMFPDRATEALEHAIPAEHAIRDAHGQVTGYDLGADGWSLELAADKLGTWLHAHGNEPRPSREEGA